MKKVLLTLAVIVFITGAFLTGCISSTEKTKNAEDKIHYIKVSVYEKRTAEIKTSFADGTKESKANQKKLAEMEKRNRELKIKLVNYIEEEIGKWQTFTSEFKRNMNEWGNAYADFKVTSQKNNSNQKNK